MHILICHERFLFRFGADRVLILLGKGLKQKGHTITVMGNRYDRDVVGSFASRVIDCPAEGAPYLELNEFTSDWLQTNWSQLFPGGNTPDAVIVGGWPFISAISFFRKRCVRVLFVDFGVVPSFGYSEGMAITLNKLVSLRRQHMKDASLIVPLSEFLAHSQSRPDSGGSVPVRPILLAADHMDMAIWPAEQVGAGTVLSLVRSLKLQAKKLLLCLGRWEPGCYKNSEAAFEFMRDLLLRQPGCKLLVLEQPANAQIAADLVGSIVPIGFPDDYALAQVMKQVDLGVSFSLWEGFNLPLAEMQWFGRPTLVFDVGAHPEVVAHPWYLCRDVAEMMTKAAMLLGGEGSDSLAISDALEAFRNYFRWDRVVNDYTDALTAGATQQPMAKPNLPRDLFIDVTSSARDPANSGVVRVARRLSRALQENGYDPVFVLWDESQSCYVLPNRSEHQLLSGFNGPVVRDGSRLSSSPDHRLPLDSLLTGRTGSSAWLLLPEVMHEGSFRLIRQFARQRGMQIAVIFYDSIPILRPDLCNEDIAKNHGQYMLGIAECDLAVPISNFSAKCLEDFWRQADVATSCRVVADVLPGEFGGSRRTQRLEDGNSQSIRILCVSTLEPRKNHRNLIQACLWLAETHPEVNWSLTLVGNRYNGAFEIADWIQEVSKREPRIQWLGIVDDATLNLLYRECSFTVYPSLLEGFGLPIVESIWYGRPCICFNQGVMAELAEDGGCFMTDVRDPIRLGQSMYQLATDTELRSRLSHQAMGRHLKTWSAYVLDLTEAMAAYTASEGGPSLITNRGGSFDLWQEALYSGCLCANWQMNDSERMTIAGLLARHKPQCSIEVGTYHAGSLSLIAQYSKMVFSIDIDETIPSRFRFPNVSFLTGPSTIILPYLLKELDQADAPPEFILIDGDHSAEGVRADIDCLLEYIPSKPLFVALHDSFNPECRRGMLNAPWAKSRYCHWVDIDFVPGRVIEHAGVGRGELWGGLALAYFHPTARSGDLQVTANAKGMFNTLNNRAVPASLHA